jgi:hypothetical protein
MSDVGFLVGRAVLEIRDDSRVIFELEDRPEPALYADVGAYTYQDGGGKSQPLSAIVGNVVVDTSTQGGTLVVSFADGGKLSCEPDPDYEAWQVVGGAPQYLVVCMPGGELAIWDSSHVPSAAEATQIAERLNQITGWSTQVREITESGGIIVEPGSKDKPAERDDT